MSDIGSKLKQLRLARNYTQQEMAEQMGVSRVYYSQWESNDRRINAEQLMQFAKIMQVTLDYFSDHSPERTMFQLMAQLESVFADAGIPESDKDKAYQDIMKIYLKSKEMAATQNVPTAEDSNTLLDLKEE